MRCLILLTIILAGCKEDGRKAISERQAELNRATASACEAKWQLFFVAGANYGIDAINRAQRGEITNLSQWERELDAAWTNALAKWRK